eukprot:TRINITY_DN3766_c0_g1_i1.p1 TRINITY_DN3766_c0_g1~~TRINITY_DN3766_c0_g1_i1.p1  ORF type:complete len:477 (-),score=109.15 TRINITY_DN3766_c0_g1_i1:13-1443(-)
MFLIKTERALIKMLQRLTKAKKLIKSRRNYSTLPKFDYQPQPYQGLSKNQVNDLRNKHMSPSVAKLYGSDQGLMLVEGRGQYVFDQDGKRYLDGFAGVATVSVGHCHPKIVEAAKSQLDKIGHSTTLYLHENIVKYSKKLSDTLPDHLSVVHLVNSGSEANDLALLMARLYTGNTDYIALRNAYHGMSHTTMGITATSSFKYAVPQAAGIHHAVNPDRYRGPFGYDDADAAEKYAWDVKNLIQHTTPGQIAGFIAEPIQGLGGTIEYPTGYLPKVYEHVRNAGGVCVADEVQTGFARTGTHMWGFEHVGASPDIVVMAKGIGNGWPLAAVVTTPEISKVLSEKSTFNTYGGNPVASAVGEAVLDVIEEENVLQNVNTVGKVFKDGLIELSKKYEFFDDVRGQGLMLGAEIVTDKVSKTPDADLSNKILDSAMHKGLLIGRGGYFGNVLRIKPVMTMTVEDAHFALNVMDDVFNEFK